MSTVVALLLQLTLWAATARAFFPFVPVGHCAPDEDCVHLELGARRNDGSRGSPSGGVTVELYHRPTVVRYTEFRASAPWKVGASPARFLADEYRQSRDAPKFDPIAGAVDRVSRKFGRPPPVPVPRSNEKRKNEYPVSRPADPKTPNSAGIYQYGPDYSYFIRVLVGSARQPIFMLLDTGAANTWLMGSECTSAACQLHDTFDPSTSKTWKSKRNGFEIFYGTGDVRGIVGQDMMVFAGITHDTSFGLANYTSDDFKHFAFDGILGLGMGQSATGTFLQTLKEQRVLDSLVVGISLNRDSDGTNDGQVTFGGIDESQFTGKLAYHGVPAEQRKNGEWAITMDGASLKGRSAGIPSRLAFIDTGTSFIFAPPDDLDALFKAIPGVTTAQDGPYTEYWVPCDTTAPVTLTFSGVDYAISARDWVVPGGGGEDGRCLSNLYGFEISAGTWLIGDTFLKNVYSVFDADKMRIGFAAKPAPSPRPTSSSSSPGPGASATLPPGGGETTPTTTTAAASESARPFMPGSSDREDGHESSGTAGASGPKESSPSDATQVNSASRPSGGLYVPALCLATAVLLALAG
ncbi:hypothetical protein VTH06DRAFT_1089 [Thermothelomyces fergusii]